MAVAMTRTVVPSIAKFRVTISLLRLRKLSYRRCQFDLSLKLVHFLHFALEFPLATRHRTSRHVRAPRHKVQVPLLQRLSLSYF